MLAQFTAEEEKIHAEALNLFNTYLALEWPLIEVLQKVDRSKLFKKLGCSSLFKYAVDILRLSESVVYAFISVSRKATEVPELAQSIKDQSLSVYKASRIVSALSNSNARELVAFAKDHSTREVDFEVARINPKSKSRERVKPTSAGRIDIILNIAKDIAEMLNRAQDLESHNSNRSLDREETLRIVLTQHLQRKDPVEKAKRAAERQNKPAAKPAKKLRARRVSDSKPKRIRLKAHERHEVNHRDECRCTFVDEFDRRCPRPNAAISFKISRPLKHRQRHFAQDQDPGNHDPQETHHS